MFVDDFLIEKTDLERKFHYPVKYAGNPVLKPETAAETRGGNCPAAVPKGGGMWWDEKRGAFRLWYEAAWLGRVAYAESRDGVRWERKELGVEPGTNLALPDVKELQADSWTVVRDPHGKPEWKMFLHPPGEMKPSCLTSADGEAWSAPVAGGGCGDRSSMFYDPFRRVWVFSLRDWLPRRRTYRESADFLAGLPWEWEKSKATKDVKIWMCCDREDKPDPKYNYRPELYNFDAVAYESIMLGAVELLKGPFDNRKCSEQGMPKITEVQFAYSRDGFYFWRPDRKAYLKSEGWESGAWDKGYVQPLGNLCVVQGDELWFYYGAFSGDRTKTILNGRGNSCRLNNGMYANGAMGLAKLRRDGFCAMTGTGKLLTRELEFRTGDRLWVNFRGKKISARLICGGRVADCGAARGVDSTRCELRGGERIGEFAGRAVRIEFAVEEGELYSFWFSDAGGKSRGYLAGGGPGHAGLRDL